MEGGENPDPPPTADAVRKTTTTQRLPYSQVAGGTTTQGSRGREVEKIGGSQPLVLQVPAIRKPPLNKNLQLYEPKGQGGERSWEWEHQDPRKVKTKDAGKEYKQKGKALSRVVVHTTNNAKNKDAARVADDVATRLEIEVEKIVEVIKHEKMITI